ncbi:MAG: DUF424 family protein [Nanoarchaeota archaeon]
MYVNVIKSYRNVVAICDSELLGKKFEEEKFQLDVKESFFKGEETDKEKTKKIIRKMAMEDSTFNIIGEESIKCAIEAGIISKESIKKIQGIPFAFVLM